MRGRKLKPYSATIPSPQMTPSSHRTATGKTGFQNATMTNSNRSRHRLNSGDRTNRPKPGAWLSTAAKHPVCGNNCLTHFSCRPLAMRNAAGQPSGSVYRRGETPRRTSIEGNFRSLPIAVVEKSVADADAFRRAAPQVWIANRHPCADWRNGPAILPPRVGSQAARMRAYRRCLGT